MDTYFEIHIMKLNPSPFEKIASGRKTVELRLYDDKRRRIDIGDRIIFSNLEDPEQKIAVKVKSLHRYATFEDLFKDIYQLLIGIRLDYEILDEKPAYDPNDKITIKYTSVGGKTVTVELYRLSDLYYVTPYGDTWMACNMQQIKTLWEKTDLALAEE